jgi:adenine-specific DNA-methyltransferase
MSVSSNNILHDLNTWRTRLGLFPMPLFEDKFVDDKFILLNGGASGDFCLDFNSDNNLDLIRSYAWSSDVGHYLTLDNDSINLHRWDSYRPERYDTSSVEMRLEDFYGYLRNQALNRQDSIVKFGISLYRTIRNTLRDNKGTDSLSVLLTMLSLYSDNVTRETLSYQKWALPANAEDRTKSIRSGDFDRLVEYLRIGLQSRSLKPNIDLLLRHAAGSIFQEAQFEILFPLEYQTSFEGFLLPSSKIVSPKKREQTSAHYTPTSIVRAIVEESLRDFDCKTYAKLTVFDPACGSGEFLREFLRQVRMKGYKGNIVVVGWDISPAAIDMARYILNYEVRSYQSSVQINIQIKDALQEDWSQKADFMLMNPPFISWELMNKTQREGVSNMLGKLIDGRPNSAGAFFWNAFLSLNDGGTMGCILPTSILEADSFRKLRKELHSNLSIEIIGRLGSHSLFADALVDAGIFVAQKKPNAKASYPIILWSDFKTESNSAALRELRKIRSTNSLPAASNVGYSIYVKNNFASEDNWAPIEVNAYELLSKLKTFKKVEDLFDVRQGVRTGMNSVFIVTREYWKGLDKKERKYFRPAVTNESIQNGTLIDKYYVFYPEDDASIETEAELKKAVPKYFKEYLLPNRAKLAALYGKSLKTYWKLSRPRAWQIEKEAKIVSTEFGKAGAFAFDKTGIYVAERSNAWFPKNRKELNDIGYAYITVLSLPIINELLKGVSKQIGGGQWYLSSKFINQMPIPDLFDKSFPKTLLNELTSTGILIDQGEKVDAETLSKFSEALFHG